MFDLFLLLVFGSYHMTFAYLSPRLEVRIVSALIAAGPFVWVFNQLH